MFSTGTAFIDRLLSGGHQRTKCFGILWPIGVGKSTLLSMICADSAFAEHQETAQQRRAWVLFNFDGSRNDAYTRYFSHAAKVSRNEHADWREMFTSANVAGELHEYEVSRQADLPNINGVVIPENQRLEEAEAVLGSAFILDHLGDKHLGKFFLRRAGNLSSGLSD